MPGSPQTGAIVLFGLLAAAIIGLSVLMLFSRNFVHSAAYLAGVLGCFAGVYALLAATFLALLQVFIYAGAITVVVVFVVMMTRTGVEDWRDLIQPHAASVLAVVAFMGAGLLWALGQMIPLLTAAKPAPATAEIAQVLLGPYVAPFEISSLVLLAALIGAIYLAKEVRP